MAFQLVTTVGQKMGIDAHRMAKSTSRHEMMRTSGYHQVKSKPSMSSALCLNVLQRRRMAISTTSEPMANSPVIASICFLLNPGLKYSVSGIKKITMSKNMFMPAKTIKVIFASFIVR